MLKSQPIKSKKLKYVEKPEIVMDEADSVKPETKAFGKKPEKVSVKQGFKETNPKSKKDEMDWDEWDN